MPTFTSAVHRVAGDHQRQGDERPGVLRPGREDGELGEVHVVSGEHAALHRRAAHALGRQRADLPELRQVRHQAHQPAAEAQVEQVAQPLGDLGEVVDAERPSRPPRRPEQVHHHGDVVPDDVLEQERGPALLHGAVGERGRL